jgi:hypothetical protein
VTHHRTILDGSDVRAADAHIASILSAKSAAIGALNREGNGAMARRHRRASKRWSDSRSLKPVRSRAVRRSALAVVLGLTLLAVHLGGASAAVPLAADPMAGATMLETEHFRFAVQANSQVDANSFVATFGSVAERGYEELRSLFGASPIVAVPVLGIVQPAKISVNVYTDTAAFDEAKARTGRTEIDTLSTAADPTTLTIVVNLPLFANQSPLETENALRHATAHVLLGVASDFRLPRGFDEGMAQYVQRPTNEQIGRVVSLVQGANQRNALISWSDLNRPNPPVSDADLVSAQSYAVVAFLVDRYSLLTFQSFLGALRDQPDWRAAMKTAYGRQAHEVEEQWREFVPRWAAGGQTNLVAAFDLQPARDLFAAGNYAAAKSQLERSQRLFTDLGDQQRLAEVEALLAQCDIGLQAEQLMVQTQQALEHHTYDRALTLLAQVRLQYDQLPPEQRPVELIDTYTRLAQSGIDATNQLDEARRRSHSWGDYPEARAAAVSAGTSFSALGDEEMTNRSLALLDDLDNRQRRLVLMLAALAALTVAWLALWLWARGPSELDWK